MLELGSVCSAQCSSVDISYIHLGQSVNYSPIICEVHLLN